MLCVFLLSACAPRDERAQRAEEAVSAIHASASGTVAVSASLWTTAQDTVRLLIRGWSSAWADLLHRTDRIADGVEQMRDGAQKVEDGFSVQRGSDLQDESAR